jgi:hypothetical protein
MHSDGEEVQERCRDECGYERFVFRVSLRKIVLFGLADLTSQDRNDAMPLLARLRRDQRFCVTSPATTSRLSPVAITLRAALPPAVQAITTRLSRYLHPFHSDLRLARKPS